MGGRALLAAAALAASLGVACGGGGGAKPSDGGAGAGPAGTSGGGGTGGGGSGGAGGGADAAVDTDAVVDVDAAAEVGGGGDVAPGIDADAAGDGDATAGDGNADAAHDAVMAHATGPGPTGPGWGTLIITGTKLPAGVPTKLAPNYFPAWGTNFETEGVSWQQLPGNGSSLPIGAVGVQWLPGGPPKDVSFTTRDGAGIELSSFGPATGVTHDKAARKITFKSVKLTDVQEQKGPWTFVLDGELTYSDYAPLAGTTVTKAALAACPAQSAAGSIDVGVPWEDITCAFGVYRGVTSLAGTCTLTIDGAARTMSYVTEGRDVLIPFVESVNMTNIGLMHTRNLTTHAMDQLILSGPNREGISVQIGTLVSGVLPANRTVVDIAGQESRCKILLP